jgi:hypothetical protein
VTLSFGIAAVGCGGQGDPAPGPGHSVCPTCRPLAGGETTDFATAPSLAPCTRFYLEPAAIDAAHAIDMGFDVDVAKQRLERGVDAALVWQPMATETGQPAAGYTAATRVQIAAHATSYAAVRLDPEVCDGTTCTPRDGGVAEEQNPCSDYVSVGVDLQVKTLDGAVDAAASGTVFLFHRAFEEFPDNESAQPVGQARADLRDVAGSLQLLPALPTPYVGRLEIQFELLANATHGWLWPIVTTLNGAHDSASDGVDYLPPSIAEYRPLQGTWPAAGASPPAAMVSER